jgi:hypothetical protein
MSCQFQCQVKIIKKIKLYQIVVDNHKIKRIITVVVSDAKTKSNYFPWQPHFHHHCDDLFAKILHRIYLCTSYEPGMNHS